MSTTPRMRAHGSGAGPRSGSLSSRSTRNSISISSPAKRPAGGSISVTCVGPRLLRGAPRRAPPAPARTSRRRKNRHRARVAWARTVLAVGGRVAPSRTLLPAGSNRSTSCAAPTIAGMIVVNNPGHLVGRLPAAAPRGVERLDVHRHDLPVLPLPRRRVDGALARPAPGGRRAARKRSLRHLAVARGGDRRHRARAQPRGLLRVPPGALAVSRRAPADRRLRPGRRRDLPLRRRARRGLAAAVVLLLGYWALMGSGPLDPQGNLAARIDRAVFGAHTWKPGFDPEGLLSTLPAIATTLLGALAGERLRARPPAGRIRGLFAAGALATAAGLAWGRVLPDQQEPLDLVLRAADVRASPRWRSRSASGSSTCAGGGAGPRPSSGSAATRSPRSRSRRSARSR